MALRDSTSSRIRWRYSLERLSWARSAASTRLFRIRSAYSSCEFAAATRTGTYHLTGGKSRGFPGGQPPCAQAARGEEGVEDELRGTGQRAQVPQRRRQQGGRLRPAEPHQRGQVGGPDRGGRGLIHLGG